ncbi:hypothetical protein CCB80_00850 [Armatimonadetes bacterium Uphvl-Ar1]|nr:hypothetical protein CCB80_00850 [Armatimonadetes bacterium Uphvl-Ar1]
MLWRKGYSTKRVDGFVVLAPPTAPVVVGFSDVSQVTDGELWMKLLDKDFPELEWRILSFGVDLADVLPGSRLRRVIEVAEDWGIEREFCLCVDAGVLMVGPPTEDAWEEFVEVVRGKCG